MLVCFVHMPFIIQSHLLLCTSDPGTDVFTDSGDHEAEGAHPPPLRLPTALTLGVTAEPSRTASYGDSSLTAVRTWDHAYLNARTPLTLRDRLHTGQ